MGSKSTTPRTLTDDVIEFCLEIVPSIKPFYIAVKPYAKSKPGECYQNVDAVVSEHGGKRVLGWNIWKRINVLIEAEAHAVWLDTKGNYIDVTPHSDGEDKILFLPDSSLHYNGKLIKSKRHALTDSPLASEFIEIAEKIEDIKFNTSGATLELPAPLVNRYMQLLTIFNTKVGRNDPCPCQSGLKYKKCCGQ